MASIIKTSINLDQIDKSKIYVGKKGKYLPVTITLNDELDNFGNNGPIIIEQTKEEREAKSPKTYLGNVRVVWSNGTFPSPTPFEGGAPKAQPKAPVTKDEDLPF